MRIWMATLCLFILPMGCGGDSDHHDDGGADAHVIGDAGGACVHSIDCPSPDYICAYAIADGCSAMGHCARLMEPTCASIIELCGCDGTKVASGACFFADGYAGGPTTGATRCADGGP